MRAAAAPISPAIQVISIHLVCPGESMPNRVAILGVILSLFLCSSCTNKKAEDKAPVNAATASTANASTDAEGHQWWKHAVFYELYPRSFADSNNDGVGDLNGITAKLDYLKGLGVDAIWITPCFPSPQVDFGYDISNYEDIDPMYGTLADFDRLVSE